MMAAVSPRVSVIMPCRNDEATIEAAVRSVVTQQWPDTELLLCDDGSTDATIARARRVAAGATHVAVRVITSPRRGAAAARNAGLDAATGDVVAFLDSDDLWLDGKLATCMQLVAEGADVVAHGEEWRGPEGVRAVRYGDMVDRTVPLALSVLRLNPFSTSAVCIRRTVVERVGRFDESLPSAEDYDFWLRLVLEPGLDVRFPDAMLGVYTLRAGSESSRVDARHAAMLAIGERFLPRIAPLAAVPAFEGLRYRSRIRIASGVRYLGSGRRVRGALLVVGGLLQWPWRPEIVRYAQARLKRTAVAA